MADIWNTVWSKIWQLAGQNKEEVGRPQYPQANIGALKEKSFLDWYQEQAKKTGLNPNPYDPQHFYDYKGAFESGVRGPDMTGHWPSKFKKEGHPNLIINRIDTRTGLPIGKEKK
jgi:hypothetical protein